MKTITLLLLALLSQEPKVKVVADLAYVQGEEADARKHKLDLYLPVAVEKPFPVLMWIHGGAWRIGDRKWFKQVGRRFAEEGIAFAAISYRLSPKVEHPAHVEDCAAAFAWLHQNIKEHGGDPDRLFISGQSAGGHLSALLALDPKYLKEVKVPRDAIKGVIPMSGVYRIPARGGDMFAAAFGTDRDACADASPIKHVETASAPMLVITETDDTYRLRPSMKAFRKALEKAEFKDVEFIDAEERNHISIVTKLGKKGEEPQRAAMIEFIKKRCAELDQD